MKIAIMQPYIFPYLGYFQLINYVDTFLIYDDANYINRGYINRNNILYNGNPKRFTIPVVGASQNKLIKDLHFSENVKKPLELIRHAYSKAPYFKDVYPLIESTLYANDRSISSVCLKGITSVMSYLDISREFGFTKNLNYDRSLDAQEKIISICLNFKANEYVNSVGGSALYSKDVFWENGIKLSFLKSIPTSYAQKSEDSSFIPNLSIIDLLMWQSPSNAKALLSQFSLS